MTSPAPSTTTGPVETAVDDHLRRVAELLEALPREPLAAAARRLERVRRDGARVYTFGNGGSATTALHLANDLERATRSRDPRLRALCLAANPAVVTALANDFGYDHVFAHQLDHLLEPGDCALAISGSGASPNCLRALEQARTRGATTLGLVGFDGGPMTALCDLVIHVPWSAYMPVEDAHLVVAHTLARALRDGFPD